MIKLKAILFAVIVLLPSFVSANVNIERMVKPFVGVGSASGVVIKSYVAQNQNWTIVLTGYHVIQPFADFKKIPAEFMEFDERGKILSKEKLVGFYSKGDEGYDYALIVYHTSKIWPVAKLAIDKPLSLFDKLFVVGRPNREEIYLTQGIVSSLDPPADMKTKGYFSHDSKIHFGNSGGPIYNEQGELVGIALRVARYAGKTPFGNVHVPINHISYGLSIQQIYELLSDSEKQKYL